MTRRALLVVDIQNEYFPSGGLPLADIEPAAARAARAIAAARARGDLLVHIRHETPAPAAPFFVPGGHGAQFHASVLPAEGEAVIVKHHPNAFRDTGLKALLDANGVRAVAVVGAMSHMCVDAIVRAAHDLGYRTTTLHDACATRDLAFGGVAVPAAQAHAAIMAALAFAYGEVTDTEAWAAG